MGHWALCRGAGRCAQGVGFPSPALRSRVGPEMHPAELWDMTGLFAEDPGR